MEGRVKKAWRGREMKKAKDYRVEEGNCVFLAATR
jgi:hypothetical protein